MPKDPIKLTDQFVKSQFKKFPHFSLNDWSVMYNHSVKVKKIALQIAKKIPSDTTLVALGALLHDIGKTKTADEKSLHYDHETFNLEQSRELIDSLPLASARKKKLKTLSPIKAEVLNKK